ncbi:MAG: NAD(P)-dependent alcohol dehydrogenase [Armatimonadota bacterium]|nr:MAG: NAD(P)-dependent alcohol dehydrogenase [Armatimonadota bacterium]
MGEKMKAAVLHAVGDLRVEEVEKPTLTAPDQALVRIRAVGVCGSDVHFYERGRIGPYVVADPVILGHESAGEVVAVGDDVNHLRPGDRVAIEPGVPDRTCWFCKTGRYNLCPEVPFMGTPPWHGAFCEYVAWPADFCFNLPDGLSFEEGAMVEPLAVGMHGTKRGGVGAGQSVGVLGCGPIGLVTLQAAKARGATRIFATDVQPSRLELAGKLGATDLINAQDGNPVERVRELSGGGVDVTLETAGTVTTVQQACAMVRMGGVVVLIGMPGELEFTMPVADIICREYDVRSVFRYCNCYPPSLALLGARRVDVASLITHRFPLDEARAAIDFAKDRKDVAVKVIVEV